MRKQTNYNKLVGRIGSNYYFCDYIFKDYSLPYYRITPWNLPYIFNDNDMRNKIWNNIMFKGAVGTVLIPVSQEYYDEIMTVDGLIEYGYDEIWRDMVANGTTEQSLEDFLQDLLYYDEDLIFDYSGYNYFDQLYALDDYDESEYPLFDCVGGGRCFDPNMAFDEIYDQELWNNIQNIEK